MHAFEKRHFDLIAETLKDAKADKTNTTADEMWNDITRRFALNLEHANPKFRPMQFYHACGCHDPACNCSA